MHSFSKRAPSADASTLGRALADAVSSEVQTTPERLRGYSAVGMLPAAAVAPTADEEVAKALEVASRHEAAIVPWGGGTRMHLGNKPRAYDLALDMRRMDQVVEHQPADLTVTVQAGCTMAALQQELAKQGQFLPVDVPLPRKATIGGALAVGWGGPARSAYGPPRDWVIGMRAVLPNGAIVKSGGKVVKNVTGYAMDRLFIGSLGTLGILLEVTCKVLPLPKATHTVAASFATPGPAISAVHAIRRDGLVPMSAELLNPVLLKRFLQSVSVAVEDSTSWALLLRAGGRQSTVDRMVYAFNRHCHETGAARVESVPDADVAGVWNALTDLSHAEAVPSLALHITGRPSQGSDLVQLVQQAVESSGLEEFGVVVSPAYGGLSAFAWGDLPREAVPAVTAGIAALRERLALLGSQVVVERMPDEMRPLTGTFGLPIDELRIMRALKDEYDPTQLLSPGRFLGEI